MPLNTLSTRGTLVNEIPFAPNGMNVEAGAGFGKEKGRGLKGMFGSLKKVGVGGEGQVMVERTYSVRSSRG